MVGKPQLPDEIRKRAYADSLRLTEIFKDIHQHPEPAFMEVRTARIVEKELIALGYEAITGIAKTGVAGILRNGSGPVVMYRADMDCNAVKETTGLAYASNVTGKNFEGVEVPLMHACGHDAHVTWMLGIARIMKELKKDWKGTLVFIAQPAEEPLMGARAMAADPKFINKVPDPDYLFALHSWPVAVGTVINGYGVRNSGSDQLDIAFRGVGGHGSTPELTKDPIVMMCNAILQYQTIISRSISAQEAAVLTVGAVHAGIESNVIPGNALARINIRWFNENTRQLLLSRIRDINEGLAIANNIPDSSHPVIKMKGGTVPLINDTLLAKMVNDALIPVLGEQNVITDLPAFMGSEDFSFLASTKKKTRADYIFVGTAGQEELLRAHAEGKKTPFTNHNSNYKVDLSAIPLGTVVGSISLLAMFNSEIK